MSCLTRPDVVYLLRSFTPNGKPVSLTNLDHACAALGWVRERALIGAAQPRLRHLGYHYVIQPSGVVEAGCSEREAGIGLPGSLCVCLVGTDRFTPAQWVSLRELLLGSRGHPERPASAGLLGRYRLSLDAVRGVAGFDVRAWRAANLEPLPAHLLWEAA